MAAIQGDVVYCIVYNLAQVISLGGTPYKGFTNKDSLIFPLDTE